MDVARQRRHDETYAKWVKEVALLFLAALVVQNIVSGASFFIITVLGGVVISGILYYIAYRLMEKP